MPRQTARDVIPGYRSAFPVKLCAMGSLAASSSVVVDSFQVGPSIWQGGSDLLLKAKGSIGWYLRVLGLTFNVQTIGTSNSAGNLTFSIKSLNAAATLQGNTPGSVAASVSVPYNSTGAALYGALDLRGNTLTGAPILANDVLQLLVTAVPTTTGNAPTNLSVILWCLSEGMRG